MNLETLLQTLGLTKEESTIYLSLLENHRLTIAEISHETKLHRPAVYKLLPALIEKGLISKVIVGKRTLYIAENPARLQALANTIKTELDTQLPELSRMYEGSKNRPIVKYVEGKKAIAQIYEDMTRRSKKGDAFYRYESPRDYLKIGRYYPALYWKRATGPNAELEKYVISNEETEKKRSKRLWRHVRVVPASYDSFDHNITQLIYKDTVAFIDFDTESATLIQNKRFADFQLKLFKLLFGKLKN